MTAEEVVKLGLRVGKKMARAKGWGYRSDDVAQDAALGAYRAWLNKNDGTPGYYAIAARFYVNKQNDRREYHGARADGVFWAPSEVGDPWARCDAAIDLGRLAEGLTKRQLEVLPMDRAREHGVVRSYADQAAYESAIKRMRCKALAT